MQSYMIISVIGLVNAYPETGYNYNRPGGGIVVGHQQHQQQQQHGIISNGLNGIGHSNSGLINDGGNGNFINSGSINKQNSGSIGFINTDIGSSNSGSLGFINNNIGHSNSGGFINRINVGFNSANGIINNNIGNSNGGGSLTGSTLVQKHIYVHIPPPEPEDLQIHHQRQISLAPVQKHYKIIFIKAPSIPSYSQQQIALAGQNQEKTIVYVLVKKPDEIDDLTLPQIVSTPPSKPEVYFIKYKAKKEFNVGSGSSINNGNLITTATGHGISGAGGIIGAAGGGGISGNTLISSAHSISGGTDSFTSSGIASSSIGGQGPTPQYGPPGKSGPY